MIFLGLFVLLIIIELVSSRSVKKFVVQGIILLVVIMVLNFSTGFPKPKIAFGGISPILAIGIMFVCTIIGIAGHYFYYMKKNFDWMTFIKPIILSPIVLLPLIGSVQGMSGIEPVQMISFGILAFQNGFFWKEVFEHEKRQK
jgi:hypothetical protein